MIAINWQAIDTVLLDMDGTLLDLHFDNYFWQRYLPQAYARHLGVEPQIAEQQLFTHFERIRGTINWYSLDYWRLELGIDIVALKKEVQHLIAVRPGVWEFLSFLKKQGKRSVIVTNAHRDSMELKMRVTGMEPALDRLISTHDFAIPKEERAFWRALIKKEPFDPRRTLFIDDTPHILDTAKDFGIKYLLAIYQPDSQCPPKNNEGYPLLEHFKQIIE